MVNIVSDLAKTFANATEAEDMNHPRRGNILVPLQSSADLLRRIADYGVVIGNSSSNNNPDAALTVPLSSSSLSVSPQEWILLRDFLTRRVGNVLEVITVTLRRQQDNTEDRTAEIYKHHMSVLNDFITDNETIIGELSNWPMPMFTMQRLCEILLEPLKFHTSAPVAGDAVRNDASKDQVVNALASVLRPEKLQAALRRCILVAPSQINIGESCI